MNPTSTPPLLGRWKLQQLQLVSVILYGRKCPFKLGFVQVKTSVFVDLLGLTLERGSRKKRKILPKRLLKPVRPSDRYRLLTNEYDPTRSDPRQTILTCESATVTRQKCTGKEDLEHRPSYFAFSYKLHLVCVVIATKVCLRLIRAIWQVADTETTLTSNRDRRNAQD
jgi:hypothetical protein